ncbi:MAG: hypothetical protein ACLGH5_07440 [Actinomycetes bacterium]
MAFGDRGRYKSVCIAIEALIPEFEARIDRFPLAHQIPGFPAEAVVWDVHYDTVQLIWIARGRWASWIMQLDSGTGSKTTDLGAGPTKWEMPGRWCLAGLIGYYEAWLRDDDPAERIRAVEDRVSVARLNVEQLLERARSVILT